MIGSCCSGKSTLCGHLMHLCSSNPGKDKLLEKMKKESAEIGKPTFAFTFLVNNLKAERERGLTINTHIHPISVPPNFLFTLIDIPGSPSYYKTAISGISQADIALVVVNPLRYSQDL